ncbi:nuclear transport factor 2 family protein [Actinomadura sp. BRA 177]|uniref:nuclear transport factor 2 family protein n=1 Tax=Actinomadura sp. BRA 177 TaxID=2745202 RepID=UPI0015961F46|nr:nuclear transport factor 2 family protein [Actinomadura sp. BRA 177]NVI88353.1 nuclear transport factor 2 family protein [Actinomadura sp. BRA 177]
MSGGKPMVEYAERFFALVEAGDIEAVSALYHDDVTVWHNYDDVDQSKAENLATLGGIADRYDTFGYAQPRHTALDDGFLRQHVIEVELNGRSASIPAILRVYVEDGRIRRIEEYFDRSKLEAVLAA